MVCLKGSFPYFYLCQSVAAIDMNKWSGQLVKLEVESPCPSANSQATKCYLARFKGRVECKPNEVLY